MSTSVWKSLPDYPGWSVSSTGEIRNHLGRTVTSYSCRGSRRFHPVHKDGYHDTRFLAREVAKLFVPGYRPELRVRHKDRDRNNCRADNLEWITASAATVASPGDKRRTAKLTETHVRMIRASSGSNREIARQFGLSHGHVCNLRRGLAWKHLT